MMPPQFGPAYYPAMEQQLQFPMYNNLTYPAPLLQPQAQQTGAPSSYLGLRQIPPMPPFRAEQGVPTYSYHGIAQQNNIPAASTVREPLANNMDFSQPLELSDFVTKEQAEHISDFIQQENTQHLGSQQALPHSVSMLVPPHSGQDDPELLIGHVEWTTAVKVPAEHIPEDAATLTIQPVSSQDTTSRLRPAFDRDVLANAMGRLGISSHDAVAQYYDQPVRDIPTMEAIDDVIPDTSGDGLQVRIPPAMMPPEEVVQKRLEYFFEHCHPYLPLMVPSEMYSQWADNKDSISPLVLEGIFACCGYCSGDHAEGDRWRALAERHSKFFEDAPRISTLQGLVILLKANEFRAKGGYHYRNWTSITRIVQMGVDLCLDEHMDLHTRNLCPDEGDDSECIVRSRLWNAIFVLELMIGGAQGRTGFGVKVSSVDLENKLHFPSMDAAERDVTDNFNQLMRAIGVVRTTNRSWAKLRRMTTQWGTDPLFVQNNKHVEDWLIQLPDHLRIDFPADGKLPEIQSHFHANLHCYYYLAVLLQHRPQVELLTREDAEYAKEVATCYDAAKRICVLQEALKAKYDYSGWYTMLRGAHFHMYCVVACLMYHLVSLWTLDPSLFPQTREFTERHMRILDDLTSRRPLWFMRDKFGPFIDTLNSAAPGELFMLRDDLQPLRLSEGPESPPAAAGNDPLNMFSSAAGPNPPSGVVPTKEGQDTTTNLRQDDLDRAQSITPRAQSSVMSQSSAVSSSSLPKPSSRTPRNSFDVGIEDAPAGPMRTQDFDPMPLMNAFEEQFNMGQFYQDDSPSMENAEVPQQPSAPHVTSAGLQYGYEHYEIQSSAHNAFTDVNTQYTGSNMTDAPQNYGQQQTSVQYGYGSSTMTKDEWDVLIHENMPRKRKTRGVEEDEPHKNQRLG